MESDRWHYERHISHKGFAAIAGVDEAGRGPLAGPVVAAAVIMPEHFDSLLYDFGGITDSKQLTPTKRRYYYEVIYRQAVSIGIGIVDPPEIKRINILRASLVCMSIAVKNLNPQPDYLLIDGIYTIPYSASQQAIPHGDSLSISIAAASIIAKVSRDNLMNRYHLDYPEFGFDKHKGYPTRAHKESIARHGISPIHRTTFKGVTEFCLSKKP